MRHHSQYSGGGNFLFVDVTFGKLLDSATTTIMLGNVIITAIGRDLFVGRLRALESYLNLFMGFGCRETRRNNERQRRKDKRRRRKDE
jgi:hypothetical protein